MYAYSCMHILVIHIDIYAYFCLCIFIVVFIMIFYWFSPQDKIGAPALKITPQESAITFENVCFGYTPEQNLFQGLSFSIPAGKKVAIVGGSGSGYDFQLHIIPDFVCLSCTFYLS